MTTLLNEIILAGGTGCLDPNLYDDTVAGFGTSVHDFVAEEPQPRGWRAGLAPSWCEVWLGVD